MRIQRETVPEAVMEELGRRLERRRIDLGLTQAEAADQGGLGKRTVERVEAGKDVQLATLIRLLRVLDLVDGIEQLIPEPRLRPMELVRMRGKERKRASSKPAPPSKDGWRWGDET